jgi:hypothetical protein
MRQTKNQTPGPITDILERRGFMYDLTEQRYSPLEKGTDYYRSKDLRYMVCHVNSPISEKCPNIILIDASNGSLPHDPTTPSTGNCVFQGRVNESTLEMILDLFGIK